MGWRTVIPNCTEGAVVTELHSIVDYHSGEFELRDGCELVGHLVEDGRVSDGSDPLFVPEPSGALIPALLLLAVLAGRRKGWATGTSERWRR